MGRRGWWPVLALAHAGCVPDATLLVPDPIDASGPLLPAEAGVAHEAGLPGTVLATLPPLTYPTHLTEAGAELVFVAATGGGALVAVDKETGATTMLVDHQGEIRDVFVADGYVYWAVAAGEIRRVARVGGSVEVLFQIPDPHHLVVSGDWVVVTGGGNPAPSFGPIRGGAVGESAAVAPWPGSAEALFAASDGRVYYTVPAARSVVRMDGPNGAMPTTVYGDAPFPPGGVPGDEFAELQVVGEWGYFVAHGFVRRALLGAKADSTFVTRALERPVALFADTTGAYVLDAGTRQVVTEVDSGISGFAAPLDMTGDDRFLYVADDRYPPQIVRIPK